MAGVVRQLIGKLFGPRRQFMESFRDKHFFITGGSTGIGLALAKKAISEGAFVTITGRNEKKLLEAKQILELEHRMAPAYVGPAQVTDEYLSRPRVVIKVVDVTDYAAMISVLKDVEVDVLVCNAGVTRVGYLDEINEEDAHDTVATNVLGLMYTVRAALPLMKARSQDYPSSIVLIGSLASMMWMYGHGVYTATKYAVKGYAECLKLELSPYQIRVNLVCPGFVATPFLDEAEKDAEVTKQMAVISKYDRNRADTPEHVAEVVAKSIHKGTFLVTNEPIMGNAILILARGFTPPESAFRALLEAVLFLPLRLITLLGTHRMKDAIVKNHRRAIAATDN